MPKIIDELQKLTFYPGLSVAEQAGLQGFIRSMLTRLEDEIEKMGKDGFQTVFDGPFIRVSDVLSLLRSLEANKQ